MIGLNHDFQLTKVRGRVEGEQAGITTERTRIGKEMRQGNTEEILWRLFDVRVAVCIVKVWR